MQCKRKKIEHKQLFSMNNSNSRSTLRPIKVLNLIRRNVKGVLKIILTKLFIRLRLSWDYYQAMKMKIKTFHHRMNSIWCHRILKSCRKSLLKKKYFNNQNLIILCPHRLLTIVDDKPKFLKLHFCLDNQLYQ